MAAGIRYVSGAITATAGAYAAGQAVGTGVSLPGVFAHPRGNAFIRSVALVDAANQNIAFDIMFFASRQFATATDKATFTPNASAYSGAVPHMCAVVPFPTSVIYAAGTIRWAYVGSLYLPVWGLPNPTTSAAGQSDIEGRSLCAVMVARGAATYGAISLRLIVGLSDE